MKGEEIRKVLDMFPDCDFYPDDGALHINDKNGDFMCAYFNEGFSIDLEYRYVDKLKKRLNQHGFASWSHQLMQEIELLEMIDG